MRTNISFFLLVLCFSLLATCTTQHSGYDVKIALDPSWSSLSLQGRENNLTAFSCDLIEAIGKELKLSIGVYEKSWNNLLLSLHMNQMDAITTLIEPYVFYEKMYAFSNIYLETGPVIVSKVTAPYTSLNDMVGREVGILRGSNESLILEQHPGVIQRSYDTSAQALVDLVKGNLDAVVIDILTAAAYTTDLYVEVLKITSEPLVREGVRIMATEENGKKFIEKFNRGLEKARSKGIYTELAKKWRLIDPSTAPSKP